MVETGREAFEVKAMFLKRMGGVAGFDFGDGVEDLECVHVVSPALAGVLGLISQACQKTF